MALTIDARAVLRAIADHPEAFPAVQGDLDDVARRMLGKQLKAKSTDAALFTAIHEAAGGTTMTTMLDSLSDGELTALIKKVDPHGTTASGDAAAARRHLGDLAAGRATPAAKADKPAKEKVAKGATAKGATAKGATAKAPGAKTPAMKAPASKIGNVLGSKVHSGKGKTTRSKASA